MLTDSVEEGKRVPEQKGNIPEVAESQSPEDPVKVLDDKDVRSEEPGAADKL
jgi:hypothetical protein